MPSRNDCSISEPIPTGAIRTAPALNDLLAVGVVVVGELLAGLDVAPGADPDVTADYLAVTVRLARVVDEPRDISADVSIAHPAPIHSETPDLAAFQVRRFALQAFLVID